MAQRTIVQLVDDVDGTEVKNGAGETVFFALDGVMYELDLSAKNAKALRDSIGKYVAFARTAPGRSSGGRRRVGGASRSGNRTQEIREWARSNGYTVSDRGRISAGVVEAYDAAH